MYAGTLTEVLASPTMEKPIDSLFDLLKASREGRAVPVLVVGNMMEYVLKVRK